MVPGCSKGTTSLNSINAYCRATLINTRSLHGRATKAPVQQHATRWHGAAHGLHPLTDTLSLLSPSTKTILDFTHESPIRKPSSTHQERRIFLARLQGVSIGRLDLCNI